MSASPSMSAASAESGRTPDPAGIGVSARAMSRIAEILQGEPADSMLRVSVEGGGCSGFQYKFDITREHEADDVVIGDGAARVVIDPVSLEYMSGSQLDYVDDLIGASFRITNPHATSSCGCGTSFAL